MVVALPVDASGPPAPPSMQQHGSWVEVLTRHEALVDGWPIQVAPLVPPAVRPRRAIPRPAEAETRGRRALALAPAADAPRPGLIALARPATVEALAPRPLVAIIAEGVLPLAMAPVPGVPIVGRAQDPMAHGVPQEVPWLGHVAARDALKPTPVEAPMTEATTHPDA